MFDTILTALGLASKTAKIVKDQAVPNNVVSNSVAINVNTNDQVTTKFFKISRSEGRHIPAMNDSCMFTFITEDAKQTIGITIGGFSKIIKPITLHIKDKKDGSILYNPDTKLEPATTYYSGNIVLSITEINHFDRLISGTFKATVFDETMDMAEYKPSASFPMITGSFCKCKFHS